MITEDIILNNTYLLAECYEHDHSSLTMSNVVNLLRCDSCYILECSRKVIVCHLLKGEVPELKGSRAHFPCRIVISSNVTYPDIKTLICEHKCRSKMLIIDNPCIRRVNQTMLKIYYSFILCDLSVFC